MGIDSSWLAPWRDILEEALRKNSGVPYSRYFQLATVTSGGMPANRTVVFRGFCGQGNEIKMITDARSQKVNEIKGRAMGEICWYFPITREQFRLFGKLAIVTEETVEAKLQEERILTWQKLSEGSRQQFVWPTPRERRNPNLEAFSPLPPVNKPVGNFYLLLLYPQQVDRLKLKGEPQNRYIYSLNSKGIWEEKEVNP